MARGKSSKLKPFEKLLTVMISGKEVTLEEIEQTLGNEIHMYRISTYIWHIKQFAGGVVKAIKDGRKVTAYQLVNVKDVKQYMNDNVDVSNFTPGKATKIVRAKKTQTVAVSKPVKQIADLKAKPEVKVVDEIEIEEITDEFDSEVNDLVEDVRSTIND
jgi:glyoxylate carboligase